MKKIMVVDDSRTERTFLESLLKKRGYEVLLVDNGASAIERSSKEQPDVVLMDVVMPGLNGFQATRAISRAETTKHIPIIICSTKDAETDKIWGLRQGAKGYLTKPVNEAELVEKIGSLTNQV
jgi:twitching motility two-component system response regulator PilH